MRAALERSIPSAPARSGSRRRASTSRDCRTVSSVRKLASAPMSIRIRRATDNDLDLILWVMLAASRSHLDRGIWEYMNATDGEATTAFLRELATSETVHLFHESLFLVAELDGEPGAAMCG